MTNKSDASHRIDVSVGGVTYHIVSQENESYMREIAAKVDAALKSISATNPMLSGIQANVLLLINLFDNLNKITISAEKLKVENEKLLEENDKKSKELFIQCDVNFELKKELIRVNELNKQLTLQLATLQGYDPDKDSSICEDDELVQDEEAPLENEIISPDKDLSVYEDDELAQDEEEYASLENEIIPPDIAPPEDYSDIYQPSIDEYFSNS